MMGTNTTDQKEDRHFETILTIGQSGLIVVLIMLVILMMLRLNSLQGTARVINYAGLVRGATQRLIKLEMTENPKDELIVYLDDILTDLKYSSGSYHLVYLEDEAYQAKLDRLMMYWEDLKMQIAAVRSSAYEKTAMDQLLTMSEEYFLLADETVSAAEVYSEQIARHIRIIEIFSVIVMALLSLILVIQTFLVMKVKRRNRILEKKAYIDTHTGLQNKNKCEELLGNEEPILEPTACLVFDINNLKDTNDTLGHLVGDKLIADFAKALKSVVSEDDFAGRYGGDEFLLMLYKADEETVSDILSSLHTKVEAFNSQEDTLAISYAGGWAVSTDYKNCTFRKLFNEADHCMYTNKKEMKKEAI